MNHSWSETVGKRVEQEMPGPFLVMVAMALLLQLRCGAEDPQTARDFSAEVVPLDAAKYSRGYPDDSLAAQWRDLC